MASATYWLLSWGACKLIQWGPALQVESTAGTTTAMVAMNPSQATTAGTPNSAQVGRSPGCHALLQSVPCCHAPAPPARQSPLTFARVGHSNSATAALYKCHAAHLQVTVLFCHLCHRTPVSGAAGGSAGQQYDQGRQTGSGTGGAPFCLRGTALQQAVLPLWVLHPCWSSSLWLEQWQAACRAFVSMLGD